MHAYEVMRALLSCVEEAWTFSYYEEKSTVIPERLREEGLSFHFPCMDRSHKVLSTVGVCTASTETDCEKCQVLQIPLEVHLIRFLCPSRGDAKVRKTRFIYSVPFIFPQLVKGKRKICLVFR